MLTLIIQNGSIHKQIFGTIALPAFKTLKNKFTEQNIMWVLSGESVYVLYMLLLTNNSQIEVWWILEFSESILLVMTMLLKIWVISSIVNPQKKYSWKVQTLNFSKHQTKRSNSFWARRTSDVKLETVFQKSSKIVTGFRNICIWTSDLNSMVLWSLDLCLVL